MKQACITAINLGGENPRVEVKYQRVLPNVDATYIGEVLGFRVREEPRHDVYEFDAFKLLEHLEGVETGLTNAEGRSDSGAVPDDSTT